ncbi:hypothetical protein [Candidatus Leptofilum sp.]|uniref:hypothetical protein n=1 Tax=Candidatus Leptofilum sp. TaxID=3241576 RepID=UPI003B5C5D4D
MSLDFVQIKHDVEDAINSLGKEFNNKKALILTEDDLKCLIYKYLSDLPSLQQFQETIDKGIVGSMVHAELPWFGHGDRLNIVPDLTIVDNSRLSILRGLYDPFRILKSSSFMLKNNKSRQGIRHRKQEFMSPDLPSKQFEFGGEAIIFELKFIRKPEGINESIFQRKIQADFDKIKNLFSILDSKGQGDEVFAYQIIFNKTNKTCRSFDNFIKDTEANDRIKVIYKSANIRMPTRNQRRR